MSPVDVFAAPPAPSVADAAEVSDPISRIATIANNLIECLMSWNGQASAGLDVTTLAQLRVELNDVIAKESGND